MEKILCDIPEACEAIRHGRSVVYELIRDKRIKAVKAGSRTLIHVDSLREYAASLPEAAC